MQVTPEEKHYRTYRKAIEQIKESSRYPYVAYTEHLSGKILQEALEPLDLTRYPETYGPKDDDPHITLSDILSRNSPVEAAHKAAEEDWKASKEVMTILGKRFAQIKKLEKGGTMAVKMIKAKIVDPYPFHLRPISFILDRPAIRETPIISANKKVKATPSRISQLFEEGSRFQIGDRLVRPPVQSGKLDVDEILDMKLQFSQEDIELARVWKRGVMDDMRKAKIKAAIPIDEHERWEIWAAEDKMNLEPLPDYTPPALFPRHAPSDYESRPTNFKHIGKTIKPALDAPATSLEKLISNVAGNDTAQSIVSALRVWSIKDGGDKEEDAYGLHLLDEFDEPAFLPITPSSKASRSAASRADEVPAELDYSLMWSAERAPRKRKAWEDDLNMELPLMPMTHSYHDLLPTPARIRPKIEPLDYSSPIYSSSRTGGSAASTHGADRDQQQASRPPQTYRPLIRRDGDRAPRVSHHDQGFSATEREVMDYEMQRDSTMGGEEDGFSYMTVPAIPHHIQMFTQVSPNGYADLAIPCGEKAGYVSDFLPDYENTQLNWRPLPRLDLGTHDEAARADAFDSEDLQEYQMRPRPAVPITEAHPLSSTRYGNRYPAPHKRKYKEEEASLTHPRPAISPVRGLVTCPTELETGIIRTPWRVTEIKLPVTQGENNTPSYTEKQALRPSDQNGDIVQQNLGRGTPGERRREVIDGLDRGFGPRPPIRSAWKVTEVLAPPPASHVPPVADQAYPPEASRMQLPRYRLVPGQDPSPSILDALANARPGRATDSQQASVQQELHERELERGRIVDSISTSKLKGSSLADLVFGLESRKTATQGDSRKNRLIGRQDSMTTAQIASLPQYLQPAIDTSGSSSNTPKANKKVKSAFVSPNQIVDPTTTRQVWRTNLAIKNPLWYKKMLDNKVSSDVPIKVLAGGEILQDRALRRSLQQADFDLVERDESVQQADLVLSASTAILFRRLNDILDDQKPLVSSLRTTATYFKRVILIFEVISFASAGNVAADVDPLSPAVLKAIPVFKRGIAGRCASDGKEVIGQVDVAFATNGSAEVASVLRGVMQEEFGKMRRSSGREKKAVREDERRDWLESDDPEEAANLVMLYGLNSFSSQYVLQEAGSVEALAMNMTNEERIRLFGQVVGKEFIIRFNDLLRKQLDAKPAHDGESGKI